MPQLVPRAYTLRLRPHPDSKSDDNWAEPLWKTHTAVNEGVKVFGDWMLTFKGGLDHRLADDADLIESERHTRRILLALSWLSVESKDGAPDKYIVGFAEHETEKQRRRDWQTSRALREILKKRGLKESDIESWMTDCSGTLSSRIRDDAVWVNRSAVFDDAMKLDTSLTRAEVWDMLGPFFGSSKAFFDMPSSDSIEETSRLSARDKDLVQKAGQWLSTRFGTGTGADFARFQEIYQRIAKWASSSYSANKRGQDVILDLAKRLKTFNPPSYDIRGIKTILSGPGYKSGTRNALDKINSLPVVRATDIAVLKEKAEKDIENCQARIGLKGRRKWSDHIIKDVEDSCGFPYLVKDGPANHKEYAVMLDHAARRISGTHSWIKRAEASRMRFADDKDRILDVPDEAKVWLDDYREQKAMDMGSVDEYAINPRAISGWTEVINAWSKPDCDTKDKRRAAVTMIQSEGIVEKLGDVNLFQDLAAESAKPIWLEGGKPDKTILSLYVKASKAMVDAKRYKVPMYRHPDPLLHPVFCDFGNSRWDVDYIARQALEKRGISHVDAHSLRMALFDGAVITERPFMWSSKRLIKDLGLKDLLESKEPGFRIPRNDRLGRAAARAASADIALPHAVFIEKKWNARLQAPRAQLEAISKIASADLGESEKQRKIDAAISRIRWTITFSPKLEPMGPWYEYAESLNLPPNRWPHNDENKSRKGSARLILCRLPGLRILSVDLGLRYAAACAVWETLTANQVKRLCDAAGQRPPGPEDTFFYLERDNSRKLLRRIGADRISGHPHPASWAILDRQFLIKLPGEEKPARRATQGEIDDFSNMQQVVGNTGTLSKQPRIDELVNKEIEVLRKALRRNGDRARIIFGLENMLRILPGGIVEPISEEDSSAFLGRIAVMWKSLFDTPEWIDPAAQGLWEKHIPADVDFDKGLSLTKKARSEIAAAFRGEWQEQDKIIQALIGKLRKQIIPRGQTGKSRQNRRMGGMSIQRINVLTGLYRLQKAFKARPMPDDPMANVLDDVDSSKFGYRLLNIRDNLRESRAKLIASRLVEAALGYGRTTSHCMESRPATATDNACQAIVIESLQNYSPDELRTRRENRQLMNWSARRISELLKESCQLNGLMLREVWPAHTSRQDSRTGAGGIRCSDVIPESFINPPVWLAKRIESARKADEKGKATPEQMFLVDLHKRFAEIDMGATQDMPPTRIPQRGGSLFVSSADTSSNDSALQADLNAAANIGLRALTDPDWIGSWWKVPCDGKTGKPAKDKVGGTAALDVDVPLIRLAADGGKKEIVNAWRDPLVDQPRLEGWSDYQSYWRDVEARVIDKLRRRAGLPERK